MDSAKEQDDHTIVHQATGEEQQLRRGHFIIKAVGYEYRASKAIRLIELDLLSADLSLGDLTRMLIEGKLDDFWFGEEDGRFFGCRDWMRICWCYSVYIPQSPR
ncbi:hypothetical protein TWF696_000852 [Orbilia brochopaga]|uniref:Uncharacterized protein n=1 Tax=Orbilia brochopaga TaxID=3140254 RepID=A0AAV9VIW2_9PEZI